MSEAELELMFNSHATDGFTTTASGPAGASADLLGLNLLNIRGYLWKLPGAPYNEPAIHQQPRLQVIVNYDQRLWDHLLAVP